MEDKNFRQRADKSYKNEYLEKIRICWSGNFLNRELS